MKRKYPTEKEQLEINVKELKDKQAHLEVFMDVDSGDQGEIL